MSIELQTGNQVDVTSSSDAELYAGIFGDGNYVIREPLELKMEDANTLSIGTGNALQNGRHIRFKGSTELTIPSGTQAQKRSHIAVVRTTVSRDDETMETIEKSEGLVLSGEPTMDGTPEDPKWIEGNLLKGDTIADFPIAKVITDGINAGEPQPLYELMTSHATAWDSLSQKIVSGIFLVEIPAGSGERFFDVSVSFPRSMESDVPVVLITDMSRRSGYIGMFTDVKAALLETSSIGFSVRIYCACPVEKAYPRTFNYIATTL